MSDYISKSAVSTMLMDIEWNNGTFTEAILKLNDLPTLDEKEIIRKPFERVVERLETIQIGRTEEGVVVGCNLGVCEDDDCILCLKKKIINIVKEEGGIE